MKEGKKTDRVENSCLKARGFVSVTCWEEQTFCPLAGGWKSSMIFIIVPKPLNSFYRGQTRRADEQN